MRVEYQNTTEDFIALARRRHVSVKLLRTARFVVYGGLAIYFSYLYIWPPNELQIWSSFFPPLVIFFVLLPLLEGVILFFAPFRIDSDALEPQAVELTPDGVDVERQNRLLHFDWQQITLESNDRFLFLITSERTPLVIPRRAFETPFESGQFEQVARHYHQMALAGEAAAESEAAS